MAEPVRTLLFLLRLSSMQGVAGYPVQCMWCQPPADGSNGSDLLQNPIVRELQQLFVAMADSGRPSADTRGLRKALHDADGDKFQLDASPLQPCL